MPGSLYEQLPVLSQWKKKVKSVNSALKFN